MKKVLCSLPGTTLDPNFPGAEIEASSLLEKLCAAHSFEGEGYPVIVLTNAEISFVLKNGDLLDIDAAVLEGAPGVEVDMFTLSLLNASETVRYDQLMHEATVSSASAARMRPKVEIRNSKVEEIQDEPELDAAVQA